MPTKHNKKRYQREDKPKKLITLSGQIFLAYEDDEAIAAAKKGDIKCFASCRELHEQYQGAYEYTGFTGFFKLDVYDGYAWKPVVLSEIFPDREHYFTKSECPIDTYRICKEKLQALKGRQLMRTYREHFELLPEELSDE